MGLAILFRRDATSSPFRRAVLDLIQYRSGNDEESLIIGTGYIDSRIIYNYSKVKPELIDAIDAGYKDNENLYLVAGGYDDTDEDGNEIHTPESKICKLNTPGWQGSFKNTCNSCEFEYFSTTLKNELKKKINVHTFKCQEKTRNRWHAKVIMKIKNRKPYAFIIGSSNLTTVAFEENPKWKLTNFECDIVVYPTEDREIFDTSKFPIGTFLQTRSMKLVEVEELAKTFVKDFIDSNIIDSEIAATIFDEKYLEEVKQTPYSSDLYNIFKE